MKKIKNLVALRLLFRLSIIEGEIGAVIGISPSLVRMRLSRINEKLRKQMKKRNE